MLHHHHGHFVGVSRIRLSVVAILRMYVLSHCVLKMREYVIFFVFFLFSLCVDYKLLIVRTSYLHLYKLWLEYAVSHLY